MVGRGGSIADLLLGEVLHLAILEKVVRLHRSGRRERPTRATVPLILDRVESVTLRGLAPVDRVWDLGTMRGRPVRAGMRGAAILLWVCTQRGGRTGREDEGLQLGGTERVPAVSSAAAP
jgi:hypothetical protein